MHSGAWEVIADTLYWIQLVWVLSGFALMAYLAFKIFPFRDDNRDFLATAQTAIALRNRHTAPLTFGGAQLGSRPQIITAGSYRFEVSPDNTPKSNSLTTDYTDVHGFHG